MKFKTFCALMGLVLVAMLAAASVGPEAARTAGIAGLVAVGLIAIVDVGKSRSDAGRSGAKRKSGGKTPARSGR